MVWHNSISTRRREGHTLGISIRAAVRSVGQPPGIPPLPSSYSIIIFHHHLPSLTIIIIIINLTAYHHFHHPLPTSSSLSSSSSSSPWWMSTSRSTTTSIVIFHHDLPSWPSSSSSSSASTSRSMVVRLPSSAQPPLHCHFWKKQTHLLFKHFRIYSEQVQNKWHAVI